MIVGVIAGIPAGQVMPARTPAWQAGGLRYGRTFGGADAGGGILLAGHAGWKAGIAA
jgi:hypothetical protein